MELSRITKHKPPRHQLYQPGFNDFNGCWLEGTWVTVPAGEYESRKKAHEKLYKGLGKQKAKQSHHGEPVPLEAMTAGQRQAWEHFSGSRTLNVRFSHGGVGLVGADMAGAKVGEKSLAWLREKGGKVIPKVLEPSGEIVDQTGMVPTELLSEDAEPVHVWKLIVAQNKANAREFSKAWSKVGQEGVEVPGLGFAEPNDFMLGVAVQNLFELEKQIIQNELRKEPDWYETPEETIAEYVEHRKEMREALGEKFEEVYREAKKTHNECERANLDNSEGHLFAYVLPEFRDDGSHEPLGPRDFPWAQKD